MDMYNCALLVMRLGSFEWLFQIQQYLVVVD